ncbi:hypothetical protein C8R44DRAFT_727084 [Mycena epipterygia]|nr:hypothetical protein C8R44DRAFT_727084 [Mycena epipterygia]
MSRGGNVNLKCVLFPSPRAVVEAHPSHVCHCQYEGMQVVACFGRLQHAGGTPPTSRVSPFITGLQRYNQVSPVGGISVAGVVGARRRPVCATRGCARGGACLMSWPAVRFGVVLLVDLLCAVGFRCDTAAPAPPAVSTRARRPRAFERVWSGSRGERRAGGRAFTFVGGVYERVSVDLLATVIAVPQEHRFWSILARFSESVPESTSESTRESVHSHRRAMSAPEADSSHSVVPRQSRAEEFWPAKMRTTIQLFYTAPFPPASRSHLESILSASSEYLSAASEYLEYEAIYDPAFNGLSPSDIFKRRNFSFSSQPYALVADDRTLAELHSNTSPTLCVVSVRNFSAQDEWNLYDGPGDLSLLSPFVRLALLRALAEERATLDPHTADWFWDNPKIREYTALLWQIKTLRADPAGVNYTCFCYGVKDRDTMHALYSNEAAKTGGVFRGTDPCAHNSQ